MAIKKTLLEIVQGILSDMDSTPVDSISDTSEAEQVALIIESVFYELVSVRDVPEHKELIKLTALSDSNYPTHFLVPDNVRKIETIWYDTSSDDTFLYTEVKFLDPLDFIKRMDSITGSNYVSVSDKNAGTKIRVWNNRQPKWYTTFDDEYIIMDGYDATVDTTLQESKVRAIGIKVPVFDRTDDDYYPDLPISMYPYLIAESRSRCFDILKGGTTPKVDQAARRMKSYVQNDKWNVERPRSWNDYGRY